MQSSHDSAASASGTSRQFSNKEIIASFLQHAGPTRKFIPLSMVLLFLDGLAQAAVPGLMGYVVDQLIKDASGFVHTQLPLFAGIVIAGCVAFYFIAYSQHYLTQKISRTVAVNFQVELYDHLQQLSADFFQKTQVGEITNRLTKDISQGVEPLYSQFAIFWWSLSVLIPACISLAYLSWQLLLVFGLVTIIFIVLSRLVIPRIRKLSREVQDEAGRINARITEDMSANSLIRAFAREQTFSAEMTQHTSVYLEKALRSARVSVFFGDLMNTFLTVFAPLALLLAGAYFSTRGVTIGAVVAAYGYWRAAANPINLILNNIPAIFTSFSSMDRILEFFAEHPRVRDQLNAPPLAITHGKIELQDLVFRYPTSDHSAVVLDHLTLTIPARQSLAIVGRSGAGKTTLIQLLLRFYDPLAGAVRIDGQDLKDVSQASLRNQIGLVMQETILLSGTVRQNLQFANPEANEAEIISALENAQAWSFINELPQGLDTLLGERGARLSGGQKQRLAIARVFLRNPPIVIFDEATSALDTVTEKQIQETMRRLFQGRTSIIIAHRLSTIMNCDRIVVLEKGSLKAQGTHAELLVSSPDYFELCRIQSSAASEVATPAKP